MYSTTVALVTFGCMLGAALLGTFCHRMLAPALSTEVTDGIKQVVALIGMMASLALGHLMASANSNFGARNAAIDRIAADIIQIDRALAGYGAEAQGVRASLRTMVATTIEREWPDEVAGRAPLSPDTIVASVERVEHSLYALKPSNETQKNLQSRAMGLFDDMLQTLSLALEKTHRSLPKPFLAGIIFWLSMLMFGINLIVAPDRIVFVSTVVGALCLSAALFLILQLEHPFEWVLRLSSEPLRNALGSINR